MTAQTIATRWTLALISLALIVSFAAALLCWLYLRVELGFDRGIPRAADTYRVNLTINPPGSEPVTLPTLPPQARTALESVAGVEDATRLSTERLSFTFNGRQRSIPVYVVDSNFLAFFGLSLLQGNPSQALAEPGSIVVDSATALELFGSADVIGREVAIDGSVLRVTGLLSSQLALHFDAKILVSSNTRSTRLASADDSPPAGEFFAHTYVRLAQGTNSQMTGLAIASVPALQPIMPADQVDALKPELSLLHVTDIHLRGLSVGELKPTGSLELAWGVGAIGVLIFATACLNLSVLVGADADKRIQEIGIRRAFGATAFQAIKELIWRYILISMGCMIAALVIVVPTLPAFSRVLERELVLQFPLDIVIASALPLVAIGIAFVSIATYSSASVRAVPALAMTGELSRRGATWRGIASAVQFSLSVILISSTFVMGAQLSVAVGKSVPIEDSDDVLVLDGLNSSLSASARQTLVSLAKSISSVKSVALSEIVPTDMSTTMVGLVNPAIMDSPVGFEANLVSSDFFATYGVDLVAGVSFREDDPGSNIVLSQRAATALGYTSAEKAVDATISMTSADGLVSFRIVGVARDVPMKSIASDAERLVFTPVSDRARYLSVRTDRGSAGPVQDQLSELWSSFSTDAPTIFSLRNRLEQLYRPLQQSLLFFSALAITVLVIAGLGVCATATYTAERRLMEMGLRRAMGASRLSVFGELLRSVFAPLTIASIVAFPVAALVSSRWLSGFTEQTSLTILPFAAAALSVFAMAFVASAPQFLPLITRAPSETIRGTR